MTVHRIDGSGGSFPLDDFLAPTGPPRHYQKRSPVRASELTTDVVVATPEGDMRAAKGDFLCQHEDGHAWPVRRGVFLAIYEPYGVRGND